MATAKKRGKGRPPKLTPEIVTKLCNGIRLGFTFQDAAAFAGISEGTFYLWRTQAEKGRGGIYADFLEELKRAIVQGKALLLKRVHDIFSRWPT